MRKGNPVLRVLIGVAALGCCLWAQTTAKPDRGAYDQAVAIGEPQARRVALEKFLADFPGSPSVYSAHAALLEILVRHHPDLEAAIVDHAAAAVAKSPNPAAGASTCIRIAGLLSDAGVLPGEAEKYAKKSLVLTNSRIVRLSALTLMGRSQLQQGKLRDAESSFKEALGVNPRSTDATAGLAEVYAKRGDEAAALATLVEAATFGKMEARARSRLEEIYARAHGGTTAGLEDAIDARYRDLNPPPFAAERYQAPKTRSDRTVLVELFTGAGCGPCVAADLALDLALERYVNGELAVLVYHQHIPLPDPMANPSAAARFAFYRMSAVPTLAIDATVTSGGGGRDAARRLYGALTKDIDKRLTIPAEATLTLRTTLDGTKVSVHATAHIIDPDSASLARPAGSLTLHIVLAETEVHYTGENGMRFHPMVVRSVAGQAPMQGLPVPAEPSNSGNWVFDLDDISAGLTKYLAAYERGRGITIAEKKDAIDPANLVVVAFVQEARTKEILQSAVSRVKRD